MTTLVSAVRAVASSVYGEDLSRAEPSLVTARGITNLVLSQTVFQLDITVWVFLRKENTGEVHGFSMMEAVSMRRPEVY